MECPRAGVGDEVSLLHVRVRRNPAAVYSLDQGLIYHHLVTGDAFAIDATTIALLSACAEWTSIEVLSEAVGLQASQVAEAVRTLLDAQLIYPEGAELPTLARWVDEGADRFALASHRRVHGSSPPHRLVPGLSRFEGSTGLPPPRAVRDGLAACLARRRSRRTFGAERIEAATLSTLLSHAAGSQSRNRAAEAEASPAGAGDPRAVLAKEGSLRFPYPTGGGVNTLRSYVFTRAIEGIEPGVFRYDPDAHRLDKVSDAGLSLLCDVVLDGVDWIESAAFVLLITAEITKARPAYRNRYQMALIEAGHLAQNFLLLAEALELAACELGAIAEDPLLALLNVTDEHRVPLLAIAFGPRAQLT